MFVCLVFFKQETAYESRSSDWSSDVCSSDLRDDDRRAAGGFPDGAGILVADHVLARVVVAAEIGGQADERAPHAARAFFLYRQVKLQETLTADPSCHGATQLLAVIIEGCVDPVQQGLTDRKSTRLNSSH